MWLVGPEPILACSAGDQDHPSSPIWTMPAETCHPEQQSGQEDKASEGNQETRDPNQVQLRYQKATPDFKFLQG